MTVIQQWFSQHFLWIVLAVSALLSWLWLLNFRKRLAISGLTAFGLSVVHTVVGVLSVKIFAFLEGVPDGMSLYGAIFFLPVLYFLGAKLSKRRLSEVFDVFTICIILAMFMARFNCLRSGCCLGKVVPWYDSFRWPTREIEMILYVVLAVWLGRNILKNKTHGTAYPIYMMTYGTFRFIVEFFRENNVLWGAFHVSHIWSVISVVAGAAAYIIISRRSCTTGNIKK